MSLFSAYRAVGLVTDQGKFHVQRLGSEHFVTVPLGKYFHIYNCSKLRLVTVGRSLSQRIEAVASDSHGQYTYVAAGTDIVIYRRHEIVGTLTKHTGLVRLLLGFGTFLISVSDDHTMAVWDMNVPNNLPTEPVSVIELPADDPVQCIMHPDTYLNKIVVGYQSGAVDIYNIRSCKRVYRLKQCFKSSIVCAAQSPAVNVIGFGLADGSVVLHDIKRDVTLWRAVHTGGSVQSISFRTDNVAWMATCSSNGSLAIWDLDTNQMLSQQLSAHHGAIISSYFLTNEPLILTAGTDNRLAIWICDKTEGTVRLLKSRSGHKEPPLQISFYDHSVILSTARLSFRTSSMVRDERSRELSSVSVEDLPAIAGFAFCQIKQKHWDNLITYHENHDRVYTWSYQRLAIGKHCFKCPSTPSGKDIVTAVAVSSCGNFGLVGCRSGQIHKFNMQSGMNRGKFDHTGSGRVSGIVYDSVNSCCVSSSFDGHLRLHDLRRLSLIADIDLGLPIAQIALHEGSGLVLCACDDLVVRLIDLSTRKIVRRFSGHVNQITAMTFSKSGREVITAAADGGVCVFDVPTGAMIDWFRFKKSVVSMAMSPNGDFLCTSHVGHRSVFLWANNSFFSSVCLSRHKSIKPREMELHTNVHDVSKPASEEIEPDTALDLEAFESLGLEPSSGATPLLSLSSLPSSAWLNLSSLDDIKKRNKPKQPVKAPPSAPFFLPTSSGLAPELLVERNEENEPPKESKKRRSDPGVDRFVSMVKKERYQEGTAFLKSLSPSAVDVIIRSLTLDIDEEQDYLIAMVHYLTHETKKRADFEFIQAVLSLFLKVHGSSIVEFMSDIQLADLHNELKDSWERTEDLLNSAESMLGLFSGLQL